MKQRIKKLLRDNGGFSLVELVVVIAIMGFLVAMIAPRILGLTDQAKASSADSNAQKLESVIGAHMTYTGRLLDGFTNLVSEDGTTSGDYTIPGTANGQEALSPFFLKNNNLTLHELTTEEATELNNMGIRNVYNLNYGEDMAPANERVPVAAGLQVLMVGAGSDDAADFAHDAGIDHDGTAPDSEFNNPEYMYRIVMGIGPECEYAKVRAIDKAPVAQDVFGSNGKECAFKNYCILLPRLATTLNRITDTDLNTPNTITFTAADDKEITLDFTMPSQLGAYGTGTGAPSPYDLQQTTLLSPNGSKLTKDNNAIFKYTEADGFTS